jgi:hypothetical protein
MCEVWCPRLHNRDKKKEVVGRSKYNERDELLNLNHEHVVSGALASVTYTGAESKFTRLPYKLAYIRKSVPQNMAIVR